MVVGEERELFMVTWSSKVPKNLYFYADDELYLHKVIHLLLIIVLSDGIYTLTSDHCNALF